MVDTPRGGCYASGDMTRLIVIPARLSSSRLPRKVLLDETGWPLIRHVYERCASVSQVGRVVVAADCVEISEAVQGFGGEAVLTDPLLPSGTDRVAAAARELGLEQDSDALIVNVQGDEPQIEPGHIEMLFELLESADDVAVATLAVARHDRKGFEDPNRVKVVLDQDGFALYFSRATIPFPREGSGPFPRQGSGEQEWLCHVGIYGFRPASLERFAAGEPGVLERCERLEQLRFLAMGLRIRVGLVESAAPGIDTAQDYRRFVAEYRAG